MVASWSSGVHLELARAGSEGALAEGLPDAVAQTTAAMLSFPEYDVSQSGGPDKVDSTCAARLAGALADRVLPFIGAAGAPPGALSTTDRQQFARSSIPALTRLPVM